MKLAFTFFALFSLFAGTARAGCKTEPPTRVEFENLFGQPVACPDIKKSFCFSSADHKSTDCPPLPEGTVCYRNFSTDLQAIFDQNDHLKQLVIGDYEGTARIARKLIPGSWKNLWDARKAKKSTVIEISEKNVEKFDDECIEWEFTTLNLQIDNIIGWTKITWK